MRYLKIELWIFINIFLLCSCGYSDVSENNWPQYRNDSGRNGYTSHQISDNLSPRWVNHFTPPDKSWTGIHTRMTFDYAYQPVIYNNLLYIGNSNDCKIYAINRKTGKLRWEIRSNFGRQDC